MPTLTIAPIKKDKNRVRVIAGRNLINYPYKLATRTSDLTTTKLMWNSVVSMYNTRYMTVDAGNFYLYHPT